MIKIPTRFIIKEIDRIRVDHLDLVRYNNVIYRGISADLLLRLQNGDGWNANANANPTNKDRYWNNWWIMLRTNSWNNAEANNNNWSPNNGIT